MTKLKIARQAEEDEAMIRHMVEFRAQAWMKSERWPFDVVPDWLYELFDKQIRELVKYDYAGMRP